MLNQVQHDNGSKFSVTLNHALNQVQGLRFQGLMNTDTSIFDYGLWSFTIKRSFAIRRVSEDRGMSEKEIKEENKRIRFLRFLVDLSLQEIQQESLSLEEMLRIVEDVKRAACTLFPGKEETFELIYRPRFDRVIQERFGPFVIRE